MSDRTVLSSSWHSQPVFVYGTLKREQPNSFILQTAIAKSQAKFLGQAVTVDCWPLIVYTPFNVPYLLDSRGTGKRVVGELYDVDMDTLEILDELEGHPAWYTRDTLNVIPDPSSSSSSSSAAVAAVPDLIVQCQTYFMKNFRKELLTTETLLTDYREMPEHRYVPRKDRPAGVVMNLKDPLHTAPS